MVFTANQQLTFDWWDGKRLDYALFVSAVVVEEAARGDVNVTQRRLAAIADLQILEVTDRAIQLAQRLLERQVLPQKAVQDALHIAVASVNTLDYLLTWNYKHIANATMREAINKVVREANFNPPVICTPAELGE